MGTDGQDSPGVVAPPVVSSAEKRKFMSDMARRDLLAFTLANDERYEPSRFHHFLASTIQNSIMGIGPKRLIVSVPPRHGKSRMCVREAASFLLGVRPTTEIAVASYSSQIPIRESKAIRWRLQYGNQYRALFPNTSLVYGSSSAREWRTAAGGRFQAVGMSGGLTGEGVDLLVIDDPHKDRAEADSQRMRDRAWDWYVSTASTRMSPNGVVIVIATRWHKDDLIGRLTSPEYVESLSEFESEKFKVINLRGISDGDTDPLGRKQGDALWPQRWPTQALRAKRAAMGSFEYSALYDGEPVDREANSEIIKNLNFCDIGEVPRNLERVRSWDLAVTDNRTSDFNAGARGCYDKAKDIFYIIDMYQKRSRWHETRTRIGKIADQDGPGRIRIEAIGAFQSLFEEVRADRKGKDIVTMYQPDTNKMIRANPWLAKIEAGKVFIVRGDWNQKFITELTEFPHGAHDDQIDAVSGLYEMLARPTRLLFA